MVMRAGSVSPCLDLQNADLSTLLVSKRIGSSTRMEGTSSVTLLKEGISACGRQASVMLFNVSVDIYEEQMFPPDNSDRITNSS